MAKAVEIRALRKVFDSPTGDIVANADIHLTVEDGSIHAVVGENGAGKSTAMKMLYGVYAPDGGEIRVRGMVRNFATPADAIACGIGMVHQHFMLAGPYSALDNILLGAEPSRTGWLPRALAPIDRAGARARLEGLARDYGLAVDLLKPVEALSVGEQQRVEILKLLYRDAKILILDEPTAVLTPQETEELFRQLRRLAGFGKSVILITHKLKEVMVASDRVTVFRAGRVVADLNTKDTSVGELAEKMVGRKVQLTAEAPAASGVGDSGPEILKLEIPGRPLIVRRGEIVGVAGVEGNGQSELIARAVEAVGRDRMGLIPEDRQSEGLLMGRPVWENFLLGLQRRPEFARRGRVLTRTVRSAASRAMESFDVRPRGLDGEIRGLSGGNQQKLIIGREFERQAAFLLAAQPTRGVDVGAIEAIHRKILDARAGGAGVLLVSSELDEILALSDRIFVLYRGRLVAEFARGQADERKLGLCMGGAA